ncbi:PQQ-dependent sugar dehydrogenase [Crossiella sp. CA-258035]|uniref:LamG-like jellyroll fold domain-containing protein n=1 Tax=Crossiella sp. CA-258035 TaxID=2981138 RepID=UPI0024BC4957|nr:LamG-like jellyroll fold domain-containing protein [Crossiella sp. CA-258035]WHT17136.1 PQQ-dependent sugar dehydrogenase [Crossiella sp. CA-258035]
MSVLRVLLAALLTLTCLVGLPAGTASATPPGFVDSVALSGLHAPTNVAFAADGRVFVAEKRGIVNVFDGLADPTPTVFADLRTQVQDYWDRGLLGLALHPRFPVVPHVYVAYTYDAIPGGVAPAWGDTCPDPPGATVNGCVVQGRVSRLVASGNTGTEQVVLTSWCQQFPSHTVGELRFGADGALYVSAGDGASFNYADWGQTKNPCADPPGAAGSSLSPPAAQGGAVRAQAVRRPAGQPRVLNGSVIRIDPDTGAGLPGNPFAGSSDPNARRVTAYGLRNPFRFTVRPGTSELWVADVGWGTWEEINRVVNPADATAENFGWPCYEGTARQGGYDGANLDSCEQLYAGAGQQAPYYAYRHDGSVVAGDGCPTGSSSVTGLAFEQGSAYPAEYRGALFFADSSRGCVWAMRAGANGLPDPARIVTVATGVRVPVQILRGPGGDMFYLALGAGELRRLSYPAGNRAPTAVATATPASGPAPLTVRFDGSQSTDPDADALTYGWDLDGDGAYDDSTLPRPSWTYGQASQVTVRLRVTDPAGLSGTTSVTVTVGQPPPQDPVPVIASPTAALRWQVGQRIPFSGSATDPQDGPLPASALTWRLVLHHCPSNCHTHPVQSFTGVAGGEFFAPDHEYPSFLELVLTARDSGGREASRSVRLDPRTVQLSFASDPPGLQLTTFSQTQVTPFTRTVIVGSANSVSAPSPQTLSGTSFGFTSWSDGGANSHVVTAPATATTYTARYRASGLLAEYGFDAGSGSTAADDSGSGRTGTVTGAQWVTTGKFGRALRFDGVDDWVTVPNHASLSPARFTLSAWVQPSAASTQWRTIALRETTNGLSYGLYASSPSRGPGAAARVGGVERDTVSGTALPAGQWSYVSATYDGSVLRLYVNGSLVASQAVAGSVTASSGVLRIGGNAVWRNEFFAGLIDEVRLYDRALSPAELTADQARPVN